MAEYDVLVVGAGVSGLRAASTLAHTYGLKVKVLEARAKIGGRIQQDYTFLPGRAVELGAEFIHGDINPVVELCEQMGWSRRQNFTWSHGDGGPGEGPAPDGGIGYYYIGKEKRLLRYDDEDLDMKTCNEALWNMGEVEAGEAEADTRTLREYLKDFGVPDRMVGLADAGYGNTAGGTMDTVPASKAMRYERAWHGDGTDLDPDFRMEPSFGVLIDHLSRGLDIDVASPVASIDVDTAAIKAPEGALKSYAEAVERAMVAELESDPSAPTARAPTAALPAAAARPPFPGKPAVTITTKGGKVFHAHRVVVTVPLPVLRDGDIAFHPPLSAEKVAAAKSMSFANGVKVGLKFSRRAWPTNCHGVVCADTLFPEMWMNSSKGVGGLITGQQCTWPSSSHPASVAGSETDEVGTVCSSGAGAMPAPPSGSASTAGSGHGSTHDASEASSSSPSGPYVPEAITPGEEGVLYTCTGFLMGVRADALLNTFDQPTIIARLLSQIDEMFGMDAHGAFLGGFVHNWAEEEYIRGAYSTPTTWEAVDGARKLAEPHLGAVYFAGEATAGGVDGKDRELPENRVHFAPPIVMHGAMQTGSGAACDVARSLGFRVTCRDEQDTFLPTYVPAPATGASGSAGEGNKAVLMESLEAKLGHSDVASQIRGEAAGAASSSVSASSLSRVMPHNGMVPCTVLSRQVAAYKGQHVHAGAGCCGHHQASAASASVAVAGKGLLPPVGAANELAHASE